MRAPEPDTAWYEALRQRLLEISRTRLDAELAEDVVQQTLAIVHEKSAPEAPTDERGRPSPEWCFQVLRNVIGNVYRKRDRRARFTVEVPEPERLDTTDPRPVALEALESEEAVTLIQRGLQVLTGRDATCGGYLAAILAGTAPVQLAEREGLAPTALYRRVYRCRQKLREILLDLGVIE